MSGYGDKRDASNPAAYAGTLAHNHATGDECDPWRERDINQRDQFDPQFPQRPRVWRDGAQVNGENLNGADSGRMLGLSERLDQCHKLAGALEDVCGVIWGRIDGNPVAMPRPKGDPQTASAPGLAAQASTLHERLALSVEILNRAADRL